MSPRYFEWDDCCEYWRVLSKVEIVCVLFLRIFQAETRVRNGTLEGCMEDSAAALLFVGRYLGYRFRVSIVNSLLHQSEERASERLIIRVVGDLSFYFRLFCCSRKCCRIWETQAK